MRLKSICVLVLLCLLWPAKASADNRFIVRTAAAHRPFSLKLMIVGMVIHIFCVGLPISLIVRRFSR